MKKAQIRYESYLISERLIGYVVTAYTPDDEEHEFCFTSMKDVGTFLEDRELQDHVVVE